jgi:hypothetical protein
MAAPVADWYVSLCLDRSPGDVTLDSPADSTEGGAS